MRQVALALLCLTLVGAGCGDDDEGKVLEGTGYEVTVPDGWKDGSEGGEDVNVGGFSPDVLLLGERDEGFTTNVNAIRYAGLEQGLDAQVRAEREALVQGRLPGSEEPRPVRAMTPVERTTLAGEAARAYEYEIAHGDRTVEQRQVVALKDGTVFTITLSALPSRFEDALPAFEAILDSWRWR